MYPLSYLFKLPYQRFAYLGANCTYCTVLVFMLCMYVILYSEGSHRFIFASVKKYTVYNRDDNGIQFSAWSPFYLFVSLLHDFSLFSYFHTLLLLSWSTNATATATGDGTVAGGSSSLLLPKHNNITSLSSSFGSCLPIPFFPLFYFPFPSFPSLPTILPSFIFLSPSKPFSPTILYSLLNLFVSPSFPSLPSIPPWWGSWRKKGTA